MLRTKHCEILSWFRIAFNSIRSCTVFVVDLLSSRIYQRVVHDLFWNVNIYIKMQVEKRLDEHFLFITYTIRNVKINE